MISVRGLLPVVAVALAGCSSSVDYGKVLHSAYVNDPRCQLVATDGVTIRAGSELPYFVVTSRLPDCRASDLKLTNHRGDRVRMGQFGTPILAKSAKGKSQIFVPFAFQDEVSWWAKLSSTASLKQGRVLLYVHGFRETFVSSSKDTAQIASLTGFDGPVIQYSWPSQGKLLSYAVDETNMYWDERNFRTFLSKLAKQVWVKEIVIVSHSLGARLVIPAVEYVDRSSSNANASNISNIVLASPDVDREDFERDIAEEVLAARRVNNGRRITVYASASDKALSISRAIHGYPRLGSPYCFNPFEAKKLEELGLPPRCYASKTAYDIAPEKSGFAMIDTSDVNGSLTGHSDFLKSAPACRDFAAVVNGMTDSVAARLPTHLSHVFRLAPGPKGENSEIVCKTKLR